MMSNSRWSRSYRGRSYSKSLSRSCSRSRSRDSSDVDNPGNNLYVTGLSSRVTKRDIEKHFSSEGEVIDVHLVTDPWTRESRGFGFVTMASMESANRCLKYLDSSVLEGRVITVEKARRRRGRTPTPGQYLGARSAYGDRRRSPSYSPHHRRRYDSPGYSSELDRSYSPVYRRRRHRSRSYSYSRSPVRRYQRSYSPADSRFSRSVSPDYRRRYQNSHRSLSRSLSPRMSSRRSYSRSFSPRYRSSRRSYSRSVSPEYRRRSRRGNSRSYSPSPRKSCKRSHSRIMSSRRIRKYSRESYSHSRSRGLSSRSRSPSRSSSRSA